MILSSLLQTIYSMKVIEEVIETLINFFAEHKLNVNADKTEFIFLNRPSNNQELSCPTPRNDDQEIELKQSAKCLGVYLDWNLTYQLEIKFRSVLLDKVKILLVNAFLCVLQIILLHCGME